MKRNQFVKVAQEFAQYVNKVVKYKSFIPSANKSVVKFGILKGIGVDANKECFIIAHFGAAYAIHFKDVELSDKKHD